MTNKMAETQIKQESKVCKESILTPGVKKHIKSFWVHYLILFIISLIPLIPFFKNQIGVAQIGQYGDFVGGYIGTIISLITLIVIYTSFKQVNEQSLQNTIALLLQSYHHTVKDYDYKKDEISLVITGREGIQKLLEINFESVYLIENKFDELNPKISVWLTDIFPTHIPAIIISILHSIKGNEEIEKQIKSMLSYEERKLLLLFVLEQVSQKDDSSAEDWPKIKSLLNIKDDAKSIPPTYLDKYKYLIMYLGKKYNDGKQNK